MAAAHARFGSARPCGKARARRADTRVRVGWDPEGILAQPQGGHIARRQMQKARAEDDALDAEMKLAAEKAAKELQERRDARKVPAEGDFDGLMDFLMDSEEGELEYEMVRCRPLITEDFLKFLQAEVSTRKLSATDDVQQGIAAELEGMLEVLKASAQKVDEDVRILVEPAERMRELLQSKDKKAHILQMVENNEIDQPLIDLMSQNIHGAREAGQEEAAEFMSKINDALKRYLPSGAA